MPVVNTFREVVWAMFEGESNPGEVVRTTKKDDVASDAVVLGHERSYFIRDCLAMQWHPGTNTLQLGSPELNTLLYRDGGHDYFHRKGRAYLMVGRRFELALKFYRSNFVPSEYEHRIASISADYCNFHVRPHEAFVEEYFKEEIQRRNQEAHRYYYARGAYGILGYLGVEFKLPLIIENFVPHLPVDDFIRKCISRHRSSDKDRMKAAIQGDIKRLRCVLSFHDVTVSEEELEDKVRAQYTDLLLSGGMSHNPYY